MLCLYFLFILFILLNVHVFACVVGCMLFACQLYMKLFILFTCIQVYVYHKYFKEHKYSAFVMK